VDECLGFSERTVTRFWRFPSSAHTSDNNFFCIISKMVVRVLYCVYDCEYTIICIITWTRRIDFLRNPTILRALYTTQCNTAHIPYSFILYRSIIIFVCLCVIIYTNTFIPEKYACVLQWFPAPRQVDVIIASLSVTLVFRFGVYSYWFYVL
jgi:hypothetical protein